LVEFWVILSRNFFPVPIIPPDSPALTTEKVDKFFAHVSS